MIGVTMLVLALGAAAGAAWLFVLALRSEHLLVLRGGGRAVRFYARRPDGCYGPVPPSRLPRALWRFARGTPAPVVVVAAARCPAGS